MTTQFKLFPSWLKALTITAIQSFVSGVLLTVIALMGQVANDLPIDFAVLLRDTKALALAALIPLVTGIHRKVSPPENTYDPRSPQPPSN